MGEELEEGVTAEACWRAGTLHGGRLDITSTLDPGEAPCTAGCIEGKLQEYIDAGQMPEDSFDSHVEVFEQMRGVIRESNSQILPSPVPGLRKKTIGR